MNTVFEFFFYVTYFSVFVQRQERVKEENTFEYLVGWYISLELIILQRLVWIYYYYYFCCFIIRLVLDICFVCNAVLWEFCSDIVRYGLLKEKKTWIQIWQPPIHCVLFHFSSSLSIREFCVGYLGKVCMISNHTMEN